MQSVTVTTTTTTTTTTKETSAKGNAQKPGIFPVRLQATLLDVELGLSSTPINIVIAKSHCVMETLAQTPRMRYSGQD